MSNENNKKEKNTPQEYHIEIPQGNSPEFSNSVRMNVSNDAVTLQFAYLRPETTRGTLVSEVVLTPQHAIHFQKKLSDTLKQHFTQQFNEK